MTVSQTIVVAPNSQAVLTRTIIDNVGSSRVQNVSAEITSPGGVLDYAYAPGLTNGCTTNPPISDAASYRMTYGRKTKFVNYDDLVNLVFLNNSGTPINLFVTYGLQY